MQWRIVLLFFVCGWSSTEVAARFNVPRHQIWKILNGWSVRALGLGYIQVIDPEAFAACCRADVEGGTDHDAEEMAVAEAGPAPTSVDRHGESVDLAAALDAAISHCEEWREEFRERTGTVLRDLRTAVAAALDGQGSSQHGLRVRDEERVSHAVV